VERQAAVAQPARVFVSYSHDSAEHKSRVRALSDRLRLDGVEANLDQYVEGPAEGWPLWMENQIRGADFVLLVCTETYRRRVMKEEVRGKGLGVCWEAHIVYQYLYDDGGRNDKFLPVVFDSYSSKYIPTPLRAFDWYDLQSEEGYQKLYLRLTHQVEDGKPSLGTLRVRPSRRADTRSAPEPQIVPRGLRAFAKEDKDFFLRLLPGPFDSKGIPFNISFLLARIENSDDAGPLSLGLVYGPSGCGKTSLVKAGLLPLLPESYSAIYLAGTPRDLEERLVCEIRRRVPALGDCSLLDAIARLESGECLQEGQHIVVVLDQFEQWLNAHSPPSRTDELISALRGVSGQRVHCLFSVRDDFWSATDRLFRELDVAMRQHHNVLLIDLFDRSHALDVLRLFGIAYARLPSYRDNLTFEQIQFLEQAIDGLSPEGLVVPIQISLLADLLKGRDWTRLTLREIGGIKGVGLRFLQDNFEGNGALPAHRVLAKSCRTVLGALLPQVGDKTKRITSHHALSSLPEIADPATLDRVLQVLDGDLHLISSADASVAPHESDDGGQSYQLTHEYMISPIREWLSREQRRTWQGRAEIRLKDRVAQWRRTKETRDLPHLLELATILAAVPRQRRNRVENRLITSALKYNSALASLFIAILLVVGAIVWASNGPVSSRFLVDAIVSADSSDVARLVRQELPRYRRWANPMLRAILADPTADARHKLRAHLALAPSDDRQMEYLKARLFDCSLDDFGTVRDALMPYRKSLAPTL